MQCTRRQRTRNGQRYTALAAVFAFLLAGALAGNHQHGAVAACGGVICHSAEPSAHPIDSRPGDTPGNCLACLWTRATLSAPAANHPGISGGSVATRVRYTPRSAYQNLGTLAFLSRGPPPSSL